MDYDDALAMAAETSETPEDFVEVVNALLALRWLDGRRVVTGTPGTGGSRGNPVY
jgi:MoxR-like ATPase